MTRLCARHGAEYRTLAERLRQARKAAGLTQVAAAAELGKPQSFVAKCESGERRVDYLELKAFADMYGTSVEFFDAIPSPTPQHRLKSDG